MHALLLKLELLGALSFSRCIQLHFWLIGAAPIEDPRILTLEVLVPPPVVVHTLRLLRLVCVMHLLNVLEKHLVLGAPVQALLLLLLIVVVMPAVRVVPAFDKE